MAEPFPDDVTDRSPLPEWRLSYVAGDDALMAQVDDLCYRTLHEPFGVPRQSDWDNMDPGSLHLVAISADGVIGYARLLVEGNWGHVRQVVVEPRFRRNGVGRALVAELVERAALLHLDGVYLNSRMPAVPLYEEAGFEVVSPRPFPMPRTYVPHVRMELRLT